MATYKVHEFRVRMTEDSEQLEDFLNGLTGQVVAIIPNVTSQFGLPQAVGVNFLWIVEKRD